MQRLVFLLAAALASSVAQAGVLEVSVEGSVAAGSGMPKVFVKPDAPLKGLVLELKRSDGKAVHEKKAASPAHEEVSFELPQPEGEFHYEGRVTGTFTDGSTYENPLVFDTAVWDTLRVSFPPEPVDHPPTRVTFMVNRVNARVLLRALNDAGEEVAKIEHELKDAKPGEPITLTWKRKAEAKGDVAEISLNASDSAGFGCDAAVYAWQARLPHEEVLFDTAKHDIRKDQEPKLQAVLPVLMREIEKRKRFPRVQYWIVGHTDTVDDRAYNQALSERRAREISRWFRKHGVTVPVWYAGFGESMLAIATPDETPEQRNRRADYILAADPPGAANWIKVE